MVKLAEGVQRRDGQHRERVPVPRVQVSRRRLHTTANDLTRGLRPMLLVRPVALRDMSTRLTHRGGAAARSLEIANAGGVDRLDEVRYESHHP